MGAIKSLPVSDEKAMSVFASAVFGRKPPEAYALLWTNDMRTKEKISESFQDIDAFIQAGLKHSGERDTYYGVGLGGKPCEPRRRYSAKQVVGIVGVHADIDIAHEKAHKKDNLPPTLDDAMVVLREMELPPSILVHSGHGIQGLWLFEEPWMFQNEQERQEGQNLAMSWNYFARAIARRHQWNMDSTFDFARVLRLPGTYNMKDPDALMPVTVLAHNPQSVYTMEDIAFTLKNHADIIQVTSHFIDTAAQAKSMEGELVIDIEVKPPFDKWNEMVKETKRRAQRIFDHDESISLESPSEFDFALAKEAAKMGGWTDQEIADVIIAHRIKHKFDDLSDKNAKVLRRDYLALTIANARKQVDEEDEQNGITEKLIEMALKPFEAQLALHRQMHPEETEAEKDEDDNGITVDVTDEKVEAEVEAEPEILPPDDDDDDDDDGTFVIKSFATKVAATAAPKKASDEKKPANETKKSAKEAKKSVAVDTTGLSIDEIRASLLKSITMIYPQITFKRIVKMLGDPAMYRFELAVAGKDVNVVIKSIKEITAQRSFRDHIAAATNIYIPACKLKDWDARVQAMLTACEEESLGEEATADGQVNAWLRAYLEGAVIEEPDTWDGLVSSDRARQAVTYKGALWVFGSQMTYWLRIEAAENISPTAMGAAFRSRHMECAAIPVRREDGRPSTKSAWRVPDEIANELLSAERIYDH